MAVKIKLKRLGKIRNPQYRIVVADARTKRDGRAIEEIGLYQPKQEPSLIRIDSERAQYWLGVGAQPTEPVLNLLKITGDWQKFKGEPGAEGTLKVAEPGQDKKAVFEAAVKESMGTDAGEAPAPRTRKKSEPKKTEPKPTEAKQAESAEPAATADGSSEVEG
ncbi:30S ribosomal protein S16 [Actinomadura rubteroloni]|uniref:Small ribosomal subunit protein bS16 n=1 Tax=Actinomadura rubteroloni TaxID=1926885 RepID=A0A2P4UHL1_9ACTN|nr:30S ribosomal protein S16 [Actinomadura rubteroloni]POM24544.1 30S ribosomal protein S16 [Actinomadura rubteroloni]